MLPKRFKNYKLINKRHWNAIAQRERANKMEMFRLIKDDVSSYLEKWEPKLAPYLKHVKGKRIIVPQFGDGLLMLACAKKGANVTGVDFSCEQIRLVREAAEYCGVKVNFVEADWQNLPKVIPRNYFDFVVTECGIFIWISDLDVWMKNAFRVFKKYGKLIVSDFHPLSLITDEKNGRITFKRSYFDQSPETCEHEGNIPPLVEEYYVKQECKRLPLLPTDFLLVATKR